MTSASTRGRKPGASRRRGVARLCKSHKARRLAPGLHAGYDVCMYECMYECMYVCMYVCVCVCMCIYIHGQPSGSSSLSVCDEAVIEKQACRGTRYKHTKTRLGRRRRPSSGDPDASAPPHKTLRIFHATQQSRPAVACEIEWHDRHTHTHRERERERERESQKGTTLGPSGNLVSEQGLR